MYSIKNLPTHVGIIMDGNGRWATKRHLPRLVGHQKGVDAIKRIITAAEELFLHFQQRIGKEIRKKFTEFLI